MSNKFFSFTNINNIITVCIILYKTFSDINIKNFKDIRYISELKGQFFVNPLITLSFSICLFSMACIPPLIGFFSKQFVLYSAVQSGYNFIAFVAILVSVISASYYLKIIKVLHSENESTLEMTLEDSNNTLNNTTSLSDNNNNNKETLLTNFNSF